MSKPHSGIKKIHPLRIGGDKIFDGRFFEKYLLGQGDDPDWREIPHFESALVESIKTQKNGFPDAPEAGIKDFLRMVKIYIPYEKRHLVRVFSTIERPLDYHGVDGIVYLNGKAVLLDATINRRKEMFGQHRAHVLFTSDAVGSDEIMRSLAKKTTAMLLSPTHYHLPNGVVRFINEKYFS